MGLDYLSFEDNLISDWKTFNALNEFGQGANARHIKRIRCGGNPLIPRFNPDAT